MQVYLEVLHHWIDSDNTGVYLEVFHHWIDSDNKVYMLKFENRRGSEICVLEHWREQC